MEKRTSKMLLAILMIVTILAADFFVLGSGIITYASQLSSETTNTNIEFSVYFKDGENRNVDAIKNINDEDVRLYAEIKVKNEGYLKEGTTIEIENSNFNLKNQIFESNTHINSIEGNKVNLKQINSGDTIELELGIEPIRPDRITTDFLSKTSTVKMIGTYVYSQAEEGESIQAEKLVSVNYQPEEITTADNRIDLETEIITNQVFAVNGVNKKIVQLLIKSRLKDNEYPVEQTTLNVSIPQLSKELEEVNVMAIDQLATNGLTEISSDNYTIEGTTLQIVLKNEPDANNEINWVKDSYDELVVTFIYPEITELTQISTEVELKMKLYGSTETYMAVTGNALNSLTQPNNIIIGRTEITTEGLYKGPIYANLDTEYETETKLIVTKENIVEEITVEQGPDSFGTTDSELEINTKYVETEINVNKLLEIVGQDGNIEIKNGENTTLINKETPVDENGNVVIDHGDGASTLTITTSYPVKAGGLEMRHKKLITGNSYTREQLQQVKTLIAKESIVGTITVEKEKQEVVPKTTETATLELKETISKAELTINKTSLSATEQNEVIVGIKLITDGPQYDLYKNQQMVLQLPASVKNVEFTSEPSKLYADEFETITQTYDSANNVIKITAQGEQTAYPESSLTQAYIQLNLNVTLDPLALAQMDKITMGFQNANATQYEGGTTEYGEVVQPIEISAPSELIKTFNLNVNEDTSLTEPILHEIKDEELGKAFDFEIKLINNKDSIMNNVKILGKLPTTGNTITENSVNTLETTLSSIIAENATVYYTENIDATEDIELETNEWTQEFTANAKLYLIKIDALARGDAYTANVSVQIPSSINESAISYTQYEVIFDTVTSIGARESSRRIGLSTSIVEIIQTEITAKVGTDEIKSGDAVKEGEVIKYTVKVINNGEATIQNVQLQLDVPVGTVYVKPIEDFETSAEPYYEEITDSAQLAELTNITIPQITMTEPYIIQYEVRVNKGSAGIEILNKPVVVCGETTVEKAELKNIIEESNIRVTIIRRKDSFVDGISAITNVYKVYIENLSNEPINGLEMQVISDTFKVKQVACEWGDGFTEEEALNPMPILEIEANDSTYLILQGLIDEDATEVNTAVILKDSNGNLYRSNAFKQTIKETNAVISLTSDKDGQEIKEGDTVEYNITVKNTGSIKNEFEISYLVSPHMSVQDIQIIQGNEIKTKQSLDSNNVETYDEDVTNFVNEILTLEVGETVQIKVTTKVKAISTTDNGKTLTSTATVENESLLAIISEEVTHTLKVDEETEIPEQPGDGENETPEQPEDGETETPEQPEEGELQQPEENKTISGLAWLDLNRNGQKDVDDSILPGIKVKIYDVTTKKYLVDSNGNIIETETDAKGKYKLDNIEKGSYIIVFEYNTEEYEPTTYNASGVETTVNSKVVLKQIIVNGQEITAAVTDIINVQEDVSNINIGLKEKLKFDLELNKYISRVVVQTNKGTKAYDYNGSVFEKVEIHRKQVQGALVVLEYTIKAKNAGEVSGQVKNIVDYLPSGLTFSSELNTDWYISDNYLYTKSLENTELAPGDEKEIKLILTKTMTNENLGLINNRAEIYQDYNKYGVVDMDSTPNNQVQSEDDMGSTDIIIMVATGGTVITYTILLIINIALIGLAIHIMIKNQIIKIEIKRKGGSGK